MTLTTTTTTTMGGTVGGVGSPASLRADLLSLPEEGGGFRVGDFVGPELGAFVVPSLLPWRIASSRSWPLRS